MCTQARRGHIDAGWHGIGFPGSRFEGERSSRGGAGGLNPPLCCIDGAIRVLEQPKPVFESGGIVETASEVTQSNS